MDPQIVLLVIFAMSGTALITSIVALVMADKALKYARGVGTDPEEPETEEKNEKRPVYIDHRPLAYEKYIMRQIIGDALDIMEKNNSTAQDSDKLKEKLSEFIEYTSEGCGYASDNVHFSPLLVMLEKELNFFQRSTHSDTEWVNWKSSSNVEYSIEKIVNKMNEELRKD